MRQIFVICFVAFLAGCATQPTPSPTAVTVPAAETARMAVLNPGMAPASTAMLEPTAAAASKANVPPGYKSVERNGTTFLCTKVATLGTKFKQEFCLTQDEYDEMQRRNEGMRQDLARAPASAAAAPGQCLQRRLIHCVPHTLIPSPRNS